MRARRPGAVVHQCGGRRRGRHVVVRPVVSGQWCARSANVPRRVAFLLRGGTGEGGQGKGTPWAWSSKASWALACMYVRTAVQRREKRGKLQQQAAAGRVRSVAGRLAAGLATAGVRACGRAVTLRSGDLLGSWRCGEGTRGVAQPNQPSCGFLGGPQMKPACILSHLAHHIHLGPPSNRSPCLVSCAAAPNRPRTDRTRPASSEPGGLLCTPRHAPSAGIWHLASGNPAQPGAQSSTRQPLRSLVGRRPTLPSRSAQKAAGPLKTHVTAPCHGARLIRAALDPSKEPWSPGSRRQQYSPLHCSVSVAPLVIREHRWLLHPSLHLPRGCMVNRARLFEHMGAPIYLSIYIHIHVCNAHGTLRMEDAPSPMTQYTVNL